MDKTQIIEKLAELGITTVNCYPKKTYLRDGVPHIGLYESELKDDFYHYDEYTKAMYKLPKAKYSSYELEDFNGTSKYQVPFVKFEKIWDNKPFVEVVDVSYRDMTLRQHTCIELEIPDSGLDWLDILITKANERDNLKTKPGSSSTEGN
jgi:hypothetical protein